MGQFLGSLLCSTGLGVFLSSSTTTLPNYCNFIVSLKVWLSNFYQFIILLKIMLAILAP